jgi:transcriptional regulator with XRE-family HTH domain
MVKSTEISERINELVNFLGISKNDFAKTLGYKRSQAIYDMAKGKAKPSFDFFEKLLNSEYSEKINLEYLISGKGEIAKTKYSEKSNILNVTENVTENPRKQKIQKKVTKTQENSVENSSSEKSIEDILTSRIIERLNTGIIASLSKLTNEVKELKSTTEVLEALISHNLLEGRLKVDIEEKDSKNEDKQSLEFTD